MFELICRKLRISVEGRQHLGFFFGLCHVMLECKKGENGEGMDENGGDVGWIS